MSFQRITLLTLLLGFIVLCTTGCVMRRTIKEGDTVVSQSYVVKTPLIDR